ncbi:hypothetical protein GCM10010187_09390 [Actinomadura coerulea]|nr:hypothetical protein GCM10010187_09390 [Actinomadura coerulea]
MGRVGEVVEVTGADDRHPAQAHGGCSDQGAEDGAQNDRAHSDIPRRDQPVQVRQIPPNLRRNPPYLRQTSPNLRLGQSKLLHVVTPL